MTDDLVQSVASAAGKRSVTLSKDSPGTLTMMGAALGALCVFAAVIIAAISLLHWPDAVAHDRIMALAWIGWLSIGGVLFWIAAFCSPYIGRIQASAGPVSIGVDGPSEEPK